MKKVIVFVACFIFVGTENGFAEPLKKETFQLGAEISSIAYKEPGVMKETGMMYGILGSWIIRVDKLMLKTEGKFSYGQVDYKNSGTLDNIDDYMLEIRGLGGYDFPVSDATIITPYIGFGYRYLNDDLSGKVTSTGARGYERESNYYYTPLGLETLTKSIKGWFVGTTLEYDYFWMGRQISHRSDVNPGFNDLVNTQNDGYGLRGSIKFLKKNDKIDYVIEPFVRYWNIKRSDDQDLTSAGVIIGYGYEPKNNSTEFGVKLGVKF